MWFIIINHLNVNMEHFVTLDNELIYTRRKYLQKA